MSSVLGIDPGVSGGLAVLGRNGAVLHVKGFAGEMTEKEIVKEVCIAIDILEMGGGGPAFIETVGYMPTDGGRGAFTFGKVCGLLRAVVLTRGLVLVGVYPQAWMSHLGCLTGGNKNVTKNAAKGIFPHLAKTITHKTADALLIAHYGWMVTTAREAPTDTWPDPLTEA